MVDKKITKQKDKPIVARARDVKISFKFSVEACSFIRGKKLETAVKHLNKVLNKKMAIPLNRFKRDQAHKPGKIAAGKYPEKVSKEFLNLLNTLKANAEDQGYNVKDLVITKAIANKGANRWKHTRIRGRQAKVTHLLFEAMEAPEQK